MKLMRIVTGRDKCRRHFKPNLVCDGNVCRQLGGADMKIDVFSKLACLAATAAFAIASMPPALADAATITRNDSLLPWIARVQVPAGISAEQLRRGVEVTVPGDAWPAVPTSSKRGATKQPRRHVYVGTIHYNQPREKYHYWIQDMSNGSTHGVATNSHG